MTKIHDYVNNGTTDPIKNLDYIDMDNEDGGGLYDVSKKILVSELVAFIIANGFAIAEDIVVIGTGTSIGESTLKAADLDSDGGLYLGHKDFLSFTEFLAYIDPSDGGTIIRTPSGTTMTFTVGTSQIFAMHPTGVNIEGGSGNTFVVGGGLLVTGSGARSHVVGLGDTDATDGFTVSSSSGGASHSFNVRDDGLVFLLSGTGINEFSTDGTLAGDSDDAVPTEKAVKTYVDGLATPQIIGGVTLSSSSNTNILNGTYVILADTTTATSVTSGIGQDSNWTLEVTQAGITNQKGVVTFTGNLEKDAGGGKNYDIAIFKNGSIVSESEQIDHKLESDGKGQSVTVMAITEFSTNDTFDIRVSGNGTADDIFCGGGSLYIQ